MKVKIMAKDKLNILLDDAFEYTKSGWSVKNWPAVNRLCKAIRERGNE